MIVACCGIPGSASTWTFNVLRELLGRHAINLSSGSFENWEALQGYDLATTDCLLAKAHSLRHDLADFISIGNAPFVVTTRDPVDSAVSLYSRLLHDDIDAIKNIVRSFASITTILTYNRCLELPFGKGFTDNFETIQSICEFLNIDIRPVVQAAILERFSKWNVERMISAGWSSAQSTLMDKQFDPISLFNDSHITRVKRSFSAAIQQELEEIFASFRRQNLRLALGDRMRFSERLFFFDAPWPRQEGPGVKMLSGIYLPRGVWQIGVTGGIAGTPIPRVLVCQSGQTLASLDTGNADHVDVSLVHRNVNYDDDLQVFIEGETPEFDPERDDRFRLTATLQHFTERRNPAPPA